jgi:hypothetical protein
MSEWRVLKCIGVGDNKKFKSFTLSITVLLKHVEANHALLVDAQKDAQKRGVVDIDKGLRECLEAGINGFKDVIASRKASYCKRLSEVVLHAQLGW